MSQFIQLGTSVFTPVSIANGGTGATSFSTTNGIVKYDGTKLVTSTTAKIDASNRITNTAQPCFRAYIAAASIANVTGDGTVYTIAFDTEEFDQGNNFAANTFTAPIAGKYLLGCTVGVGNLAAGHTAFEMTIVTTSATYILSNINPTVVNVANDFTIAGSIIVPMALNDTAIVQVQVVGGAKQVSVLGTIGFSSFWGNLIC